MLMTADEMAEWDKDLEAVPVDGRETVWVCVMCGKTAEHRLSSTICLGWDESCMLNASLCFKNRLEMNGALAVRVLSGGWVKHFLKTDDKPS